MHVLLLEHLINPLEQRIYCNSELDLSSIATVVLNNARPWGLFLWTAAGCIAWEILPLIVAMQMLSHMTNYLASSCAGELLRPVQRLKLQFPIVPIQMVMLTLPI